MRWPWLMGCRLTASISDRTRHAQDIPDSLVRLPIEFGKRPQPDGRKTCALQKEAQFLGEKITYRMTFVGFAHQSISLESPDITLDRAKVAADVEFP
jgi:hypothetical protein